MIDHLVVLCRKSNTLFKLSGEFARDVGIFVSVVNLGYNNIHLANCNVETKKRCCLSDISFSCSTALQDYIIDDWR